MNEIGVWAIVVSVALAIVGAIWTMLRRETERIEERLDEHIKDDVKVHERVAVSESRLDRVESDIGDHNSGLRGWVHKLANDISPYIVRRQGERDK